MSLVGDLAGRRGYFALSLVVVLADQATKILAHRHLRGKAPVEIVPDFFSLWYSRNPGGLFGYFRDWDDPWRTLLLTVLPLVAIVLIAGFVARTADLDRWTLFGSSLILGGAVGNLIDRIARGEVIDFLDVYVGATGLRDWLEAKFGTAHWPTFNVADSAIVVGAGLLVVSIFHGPPATAEPDDEPGEDRAVAVDS